MECKNFVFAGRYGWLPAKSYDFALHRKNGGKLQLSPGFTVLLVAISIAFGYFVFWQYKFWAYRLKIRRIKRCVLDKAKGVVPVLLPKEYYTRLYYAYKKRGADPFFDRFGEFDSLKKTFLFMLYYSFPKYLSYEHLRLLAETSNPFELEKVVYYCVESKKVEMRKGHLGCFKMTLSTYCIMGQPSIVQKIPCMKE